MQFTAVGETFDSPDFCFVGLDCKHEAGTDGLSPEQDCASSANTMLASDMGAGETENIAHEIDQQHPGRLCRLLGIR